MGDSELSFVQKEERRALTGDRLSVISVVSALRHYRRIVGELIAEKGNNKPLDNQQWRRFKQEVAEVESGEVMVKETR